MDLVDVLHQTLSNDRDVSDSAQVMIDAHSSLNLDTHLTALVSLLLDMENGESIRSAAAFQIVTTLKSGDPLENRIDYSYRWFSIGADFRQNIKTALLKSLNFEAGRPSFVAACLTFIAEIDFCRDQWPDLLNVITENIMQMNNPDHLRQNSLEVIGLLAQKFENESCGQLDSNDNEIFRAIFHAFKTENSHCVKTSAVECLMHWMRFINIKSQHENDVICALNVLFEYIEIPEFQKTALKSLTGILKKYNTSLSYPLCSNNIDRLFMIMMAAITNIDVNVRIEGFRFCEELCTAEGSVLKFLRYPINRWNYTKVILPDLLDILMNVITYQDEICVQPASMCLSTLATRYDESAMQNFLLTFFRTNIASKDWRLRNASVIAFNSFGWGGGIKSPSLAEDLLPILLDILTNDDHIEVKVSVAISIEKLSLVMAKLEMQENHVKLLINIMLVGLNMAPKIASHFCKALQGIADASFELMALSSAGGFLWIEYFQPIVEKLLETMNRTDAGDDLCASVYEALNGIVESCPSSYPAIGKIAPIIIQHHLQIEQKLENFAMASSLLSTLKAVLQKMPDDEAYELSYLIVPSLLQIFIKSVYNSNVRSITFYIIATIVKKLKHKFSKHLDVLHPFLISELKNPKRYQVCIAVIQLIRCICQNIADQVVCFSGDILPTLLKHLQNGCVSQRLKESILVVIGDITAAVGPQLKNHVEIIVVLMSVQSQMDKSYMMSNRLLNLNYIHGKFLSAYSGVLTEFKGDEVTLNYITQLLDPHLNQMIQVALGIIENKSEDEILEELVMSKSIHFLYKFVNCFERSVLNLIDTKTIKKLLVKGSHSETEETKRIAILTMERLIALKRQALQHSCDQN